MRFTLSSKFLSRFSSGFLFALVSRLCSGFHHDKHPVQEVVQQLFGMAWFSFDGEDACWISCWDLQLCEVSEESEPTTRLWNSEPQHTFGPAEPTTIWSEVLLFLLSLCIRLTCYHLTCENALLKAMLERSRARKWNQEEVPLKVLKQQNQYSVFWINRNNSHSTTGCSYSIIASAK